MRNWWPVILWMAIIFVISTNLGSAAHTSLFLHPLVLWIYPGAGEALFDRIHFVIRKGGHLTEYAVLAALIFRALYLQSGGAKSLLRLAGLAWILSAAYAASDEFHQSFVSSRTASVEDVLIDSVGAACSLLVLLRVFYRRNRRSRPSYVGI